MRLRRGPGPLIAVCAAVRAVPRLGDRVEGACYGYCVITTIVAFELQDNAAGAADGARNRSSIIFIHSQNGSAELLQKEVVCAWRVSGCRTGRRRTANGPNACNSYGVLFAAPQVPAPPNELLYVPDIVPSAFKVPVKVFVSPLLLSVNCRVTTLPTTEPVSDLVPLSPPPHSSRQGGPGLRQYQGRCIIF